MNAQIDYIEDEIVNVKIPIIIQNGHTEMFDFGRMDPLDFYRIVYCLQDIINGAPAATTALLSGTVLTVIENDDIIDISPVVLASTEDEIFKFSIFSNDAVQIVQMHA